MRRLGGEGVGVREGGDGGGYIALDRGYIFRIGGRQGLCIGWVNLVLILRRDGRPSWVRLHLSPRPCRCRFARRERKEWLWGDGSVMTTGVMVVLDVIH